MILNLILNLIITVIVLLTIHAMAARVAVSSPASVGPHGLG